MSKRINWVYAIGMISGPLFKMMPTRDALSMSSTCWTLRRLARESHHACDPSRIFPYALHLLENYLDGLAYSEKDVEAMAGRRDMGLLILASRLGMFLGGSCLGNGRWFNLKRSWSDSRLFWQIALNSSISGPFSDLEFAAQIRQYCHRLASRGRSLTGSSVEEMLSSDPSCLHDILAIDGVVTNALSERCRTDPRRGETSRDGLLHLISGILPRARSLSSISLPWRRESGEIERNLELSRRMSEDIIYNLQCIPAFGCRSLVALYVGTKRDAPVP